MIVGMWYLTKSDIYKVYVAERVGVREFASRIREKRPNFAQRF